MLHRFQINDRGLTTIGLDLRHVTNDVGKGFIIRNLAGNQGEVLLNTVG